MQAPLTVFARAKAPNNQTSGPALGSRKTVELNNAGRKNVRILYKAICEKLATCRPDIVADGQCQMKISDDDPFVQTLPQGALIADKAAIKGCAASLSSIPCPEFFRNQAPTGCEFFNK